MSMMISERFLGNVSVGFVTNRPTVPALERKRRGGDVDQRGLIATASTIFRHSFAGDTALTLFSAINHLTHSSALMRVLPQIYGMGIPSLFANKG